MEAHDNNNPISSVVPTELSCGFGVCGRDAGFHDRAIGKPSWHSFLLIWLRVVSIILMLLVSGITKWGALLLGLIGGPSWKTDNRPLTGLWDKTGEAHTLLDGMRLPSSIKVSPSRRVPLAS